MSKVTNKEEKKKTLFSSGGVFVDIFIGFLIAACLAGIVYRCFIYNPDTGVDQGESYMVYFEIEDAHESYARYLESGDAVYCAKSGLRLGAIAVHEQSDENSVLAEHQRPDDDKRVFGVLRSIPGVLREGTLVLDGSYMLTPGQTLEIYTDTVSVTVRIIRIASMSEIPTGSGIVEGDKEQTTEEQTTEEQTTEAQTTEAQTTEAQTTEAQTTEGE